MHLMLLDFVVVDIHVAAAQTVVVVGLFVVGSWGSNGVYHTACVELVWVVGNGTLVD